MLIQLFACVNPSSPDPGAPDDSVAPVDSVAECPLSGETGLAELMTALEAQGCLHPDDVAALRLAEEQRLYETTLHCNSVYRVASSDGLDFSGPLERVLDHASVPDVLVLEDGSHLLVYNDVTPFKLSDTLAADPDRIWRQGLIGQGGVGMSVDSGDGFVEVLDADLQLEQVQLAVDPDLGVKPDGTIRLVWFGIHTEDFENGDDPMGSAKPHKFYRSTSSDARLFSTPEVAVASSEGETGGVDPAVLDLDDGGEILMVGPLDNTAMAWVSEDGDSWDPMAPPDFDTEVSAATVDPMPDPDGGYRMYYMQNGSPGTFKVSMSEDGHSWDTEGQTILTVSDSFNVTVAKGPELWWIYINALEPNCVAEWGG